MTMVESRPRDDSHALGGNSVDEAPHGPASDLPIDLNRMPIVVYLATDFRKGPPDNGQISLKATLLAAAWADIAVVRWTPGPGRLDGVAEKIDPRNHQVKPKTVNVDHIRNWSGGVVLVASWPNNEDLVRAAEVVFTGPYGEPRIVRDAGNARIHMHDRYAGYGSGIDYASRRRK